MAEPTADDTRVPTRYADPARRYRLDGRIATGGMGTVWRATDTVLDRRVAVKLLKQEYADDPTFRSRFETEARHAAGLHHPGVAQVFDFGGNAPGADDAAGAPYLVMEYVEGKPLSALLRSGEAMDPAAAAALLAGAGDAIGAAHGRGIVHRDVKPANLMVTDDRGVKITDFGIARAADGLALTETGQVMGTPLYFSPEQAQGKAATPASDVYSLGVVGFECLSGRRPYVADSAVATALAHLREPVPELPDDVPPALAAVVRRAMAKDPADRYPDGDAFASAVRGADLDAGAPVPEPQPEPEPDETRLFTAPVPVAAAPVAAAVPAEPVPVSTGRTRRIPLAAWLVAGALVLVLVVALAIELAGGGSPSPTTEQTAGPTSGPTSGPTTAPTTVPTTAPTTAPTSATSPTTPTTSPSESVPATITLDPATYVGRPVKDVTADLKDLQLKAKPQPTANDGTHTEGTVASVSPTSGLVPGDSVTVAVWDAPDKQPGTKHGHDHNGRAHA